MIMPAPMPTYSAMPTTTMPTTYGSYPTYGATSYGGYGAATTYGARYQIERRLAQHRVITSRRVRGDVREGAAEREALRRRGGII